MIQSLLIKNIALINNTEIFFSSGLNVLSGETGAGKSVILESLNFVLGAKADKTLIRSGESECFVQAIFDVSNNKELLLIFNENDIDFEDNLIITRKYNTEGKNTVKVNGMSVTNTILKRITSKLVDIHGQSEHFYLLKNSNQLELIDKYGSEDIYILKNNIRRLFNKLKNILNELNDLGGNDQQRLIRLDILKYQINEIEQVDMKEDEDLSLDELKNKINHQEKILNSLNYLKDLISNENGICDLLRNAIKNIDNISHLNPAYQDISNRLSDCFTELSDISNSSSSLIDVFDSNEYDINTIEDRIEQIKNLKKKYGNDYNAIQQFQREAKNEIEKLENFNTIAENLLSEQELCKKQLYEYYQQLNKLRIKSAHDLSKQIVNELKELNMPNANFTVSFTDFPSYDNHTFSSANGDDCIEFLFSANKGEPLKPLSNIISGGEMSRFMLSLKAQTAKQNEISTFIFDEIDTGISGLVAKTVAEKFAKISKNVQIIAISHLPQISAMADNNLLITKNELNDKAITTVKKLNKDEKVDEIIRLIGGETTSSSAIKHAKELIENAEKYKKEI